MKRLFIILGAVVVLTSCETNSVETKTEISSSVPATETSKADYDKYYDANGTELRINMSQYSDNAKLFTADDIYLLSFNSGYISGNHPTMMIIEDNEQLEFAFERYGLALSPENLTRDELWDYNTSISKPFNEMVEKYPIDEYSYVIQYDEVGCDGYDFQVGALLIDKEVMSFVHTVDSKSPDTDFSSDVMDGFCYMAAVPKGMLMSNCYKRWTYPDRNDMYQDIDYSYSVNYAVSDSTELYRTYGDKGYIITNEDELELFINMASSVKDYSNNQAFRFSTQIDYDKAVLLFKFFKSNETIRSHPSYKVTIENNNINMEYDTSEGNSTGLAYAAIPIRFLPDNLSGKWYSPTDNDSYEDTPEIDMSKYGKNAKLYTADEIILYSNPIGDLGFDGKYILEGSYDDQLIEIAWDNYGFVKDQGFVNLVENNLFGENVFFIQYIPETEKNSDLRVLGFVIDDDKAEFIYYDRNSKREYTNTNDSGGVGFYAAVPIDEIKDIRFSDWKIPT